MKHGRSAVRASVGGGFEGTPDRLQRSVLKKGLGRRVGGSFHIIQGVSICDILLFDC